MARPTFAKTIGVTADEAVAGGLTSTTTGLTTSGGGVCLVPKGTYIISASGITAPFIRAVSSGVHLVGGGHPFCRLTGCRRIICCNVTETTGAWKTWRLICRTISQGACYRPSPAKVPTGEWQTARL